MQKNNDQYQFGALKKMFGQIRHTDKLCTLIHSLFDLSVEVALHNPRESPFRKGGKLLLPFLKGGGEGLTILF